MTSWDNIYVPLTVHKLCDTFRKNGLNDYILPTAITPFIHKEDFTSGITRIPACIIEVYILGQKPDTKQKTTFTHSNSELLFGRYYWILFNTLNEWNVHVIDIKLIL